LYQFHSLVLMFRQMHPDWVQAIDFYHITML